ncbi:MAG: YolD-like family protein [Clostridia bacterium]|nr:YolD-like family protein [Clostridia bacterium]
MNRQERAKQFMAFDALKGLQEELRKKEIEYEQKKEISEWVLEELEDEFRKINIGEKVQVKYYKDGKYKTIVGIVKKINYVEKKFAINEEIINVNDVINLTIVKK